MKRILVTGAAGFIGSHLINELSHTTDYKIIAIDNESINKFTRSIPTVEYIKADIRDKETIRSALHKVDTVIHLAADTRVINSIEDPVTNFDINVVGTFNLLHLACEAGVSTFINASTGGAILGETLGPAHEEIAANPISPYGASKLATEGYCSAFSNTYGIRTISLRFANVYGPGSYHKNSVIAHYFKQLLKNEELVVFGDGSQIRDFIYIEDLIKGICSAAQRSVSGVFQLGSGQPTTLNQLIQIIQDATGREIKIRFEPSRHGEIHTTWCNIKKAKTELEFFPSTSLSQGIALCWQWFLNTSADLSIYDATR